MREDKKYQIAKKKVARLRTFYGSLATYVLVIFFLGALNYYFNKWEHIWFLWVAFGWGIGLAVQAAKIFGWNLLWGKKWEQRKIKEYMQEDEKL